MPQLDSIERMVIYSDEDAALEEPTYGENTTSTIDRNSALALIGILKQLKDVSSTLSFEDTTKLVLSTGRAGDRDRFPQSEDLMPGLINGDKIGMVKALNNILDDLIGRLRETVPIRPLGFYSGDLITVNMDYSNNTYYVCVANGKVKVPLSSNDTPGTITLERAIELLTSKR